MTNTYDTSNFLPCPFCGAKPEAIDWPGGPMAKVFIHCPNDNYDSEDGGCSVGPDVVGSDIEQAAARWNRRAQVPDDLPPVPYNEHEKKLLKEIESRDYWEEKATELAERVGEYFGFDVGEHSNANCPVQAALEADWQPPQAAEPEGHKEAIGLVEVLESIIAHYPHPDIDHERFRVLACRFAEQALSEYRQQEEVEANDENN